MSGTVAKPRIFIDYIAYARAIGKPVVYISTSGASGSEQYPDVFTLNPAKTNTITTTSATTILKCGINHAGYQGDTNGSDRSIEFSKLIQSVNYWGILGHNLDDISSYPTLSGVGNDGSITELTSVDIYPEIQRGFLLKTTSGFPQNESFGASLKFSGHTSGDQIKIGSFTMGRSYTFPHNANLSMNINYNQDGIKKTRTAGGSDLVDINYYKSPDWGDHKVWSYAEQDMRDTGYAGRRGWDLTFSYLQKEDTFPQDMNDGFMFDQSSNSWTQHSTENITSHFMTLTLNGQIPFIFQPDDTVSTFALCRLKNNAFSVQQSAPNLYTCKMSFEETW